MTDDQQPERRASTPRGKRRGRTRRRHTVAFVVLVTSVVLAMVTGLAVSYLYRHLEGNVRYESVEGLLDERPEKVEVEGSGEPLNVLVMGSDSREGDGNNIDGLTGGGERSDTTILLHLSADRERAYGISIPRDSLVDRPECTGEDGESIPAGGRQMWNAAFGLGGPACTIQQFEQVTGVRVDNYVVVDFRGFKDMVNAIDGVEVCIPEDIHDPAHGIDLDAGTRVLKDVQALNYVRARYSIGDGSDIGRVKRQQAFMSAMVSKVISSDTLWRPDRLVGFLDAATRSITTDFTSLSALADLGLQVRDIGLERVQFLTVPWHYSTDQPGRVEWDESAQKMWRRIAEDKPLGEVATGVISAAEVPGSGTSSAGPSEEEPPEEAEASEDPENGGTDDASGTAGPGQNGSPSGGAAAISEEELASAGLCT